MIQVQDKFTHRVHKELEETSVEAARAMLNKALVGSKRMRRMPVHERARILEATSESLRKNARMLAETIAIEAGKPIKYSLKEAGRAAVTMKFSAEEAKRIHGETVPFDAEPRGEGMFAYYVREPVGVVFAITPFNDPLNLVAHKLGPAIASGNSTILKPSLLTPLSAIRLVDLTRSAGLPDECAQVLVARGDSEPVRELLREDRIKVVSFTGGTEAAAEIVRRGGVKKYSMELGSNSPVILWEDADLDRAVPQVVDAAFESQGQNCIHAQRVLVHARIYDEVRERILEATRRLKVGNPLSEDTDVGPMITEREAQRVADWVQEAIQGGAQVLAGGERQGSVYPPTVLEGVSPKSRIAQQEIFGPVTILFRISSLDEAIELSNSVPYGLQAGVFTNDLAVAQKCVQGLEYGSVLINQTSDFRVDFMPFGGFKHSGLGREGIRFAIEAMTEIKLVVYQGAG
ncbi:MAG TPA: aldehyde dehydrogenase family protein [Thermoplasmata archaeon]|nr:aldehyde dehydrogenase family protein [Thermoplasmata archaeon]